jgi:hypothetical protein
MGKSAEIFCVEFRNFVQSRILVHYLSSCLSVCLSVCPSEYPSRITLNQLAYNFKIK